MAQDDRKEEIPFDDLTMELVMEEDERTYDAFAGLAQSGLAFRRPRTSSECLRIADMEANAVSKSKPIKFWIAQCKPQNVCVDGT
jgi:hypothetical protein